MRRFSLLSWLLLSLPVQSAPTSLLQAAGQSRIPCQTTLTDCPPGTIIVGKNDSRAHFTTIQAAIQALPDDDSPQTILILAGNYTEQLNITRAGPVTLLGQTAHPTDATQNKVTVFWAAANSNTYPDNAYTSVLTVAPTLDASLTGSGPTGYPVPPDTPFGNRDFRAYNVDFRNVFSEYSAGPALAVSLSYANGGFYYCGFYSYQDTVYIGKLGNAYFYSSIIAGQTDFLYGFGTAWFQSSQLVLRNCGGGITAWKGTNTTFPNKYGVYIVDSRITAANASVAQIIQGKCALGRPWNSQHRSIFARTYEDGSIISSGYIDWIVDGVGRYTPNVTLMAEYKTYGPGFNLTGRLDGKVDTLLSDAQYAAYDSPAKVFQTETGEFGNVGWIDWTPWSQRTAFDAFYHLGDDSDCCPCDLDDRALKLLLVDAAPIPSQKLIKAPKMAAK
ncbi:hypothetical protein VTN77DRAFT_8430 [Rasamsonia byssochlamydoides]|uniref:uncharacterized protein n=1 Tax=Rasamsonia byssochlamydoides TaxID=89139 RepID=UPI003742674A